LPELESLLQGRVCLLGVGNTMKGDDGAGSLLIGRVAGRVEALCVDGGVAPENFVEKVARWSPDTVLVVDAMQFDGAPGEVRVFAPSELGAGAASTHAGSLSVMCEYIEARGDTRVHLLGIQPGSMRLGDGMSEPVADAVHRVASELLRVLPQSARTTCDRGT